MAKRNSRLYKSLSACKPFWILAALALWCIAQISDRFLQIGFIVLIAFFLWIRFDHQEVLFKIGLWFAISLTFVFSIILQQPQPPTPGLFEVQTIRNGYAVLQKENEKVVTYEKEELMLGDVLDIEKFEPVHTQNNQPLFCFADYLKSLGNYAKCKKFSQSECYKYMERES